MQKNNPEVQFVFNPCKDRLKTEKIIKIFYTALKRHGREVQNDTKSDSSSDSRQELSNAKKAVGRSG